MTQTYDVIIIGAGIIGCSTAFHLSKQGLKVALLEKEDIGAGSTGRSSAIVRQHYSNTLTAQMALHSMRIFHNFEEAVGGDSGFTQTGFLVFSAAEDQAGLEANIALQRGVGINTELVSTEGLADIFPNIKRDDLMMAAYESEGGYADPHLTTTAYANAARRHGTQVFLDTHVTNIRFEKDKVVGVETTKENFDAPQVLNCAGPWGARVAKMAGIEVPIKSCRVQVTLFRRPPTLTAHPVVVDFIHASYFRSETGNLTLCGLVDPEEANAVVDPDNYDENVELAFVADVGERVIERYPMMEQCENIGGYAGLYAITPDWHPIVDELPAGSGCFICTGFSGHGFKLAPAVGVMAADMLTGASAPEFDAHLFRFSRYAEDDLVRGQYAYSIAG
ncbi:FAD-dependent oxidoreductase [Anaerolineales bacterium HSG24]|nr:FAD-dependent oxidoreductase [Anaerolineales bacterium HSG24]